MVRGQKRDVYYMSKALELAEKGLYTTSPNPRVGCVIVQADSVVGEGWHVKAGEPHAEVIALKRAGSSARGAEVYISLEPCNHTGRTKPCVGALLSAGVARVVAAMKDPNPKVAGCGFDGLLAGGVEVSVGICESEARSLNEGFQLRMEKGRPLVRVKMASTLDGRTAAMDGSSKWITSEPARRDVQRYRARSCALVTGIGTVIEDDPRLNARLDEPVKQPLRVVLDGNARLDPGAALFSVDGPVLIVTSAVGADDYNFDERTECIQLSGKDGRVDLAGLLGLLADRGANEVLVEAGAGVAGAFVSRGLVDEIVIYSSPDLLGSSGRGMFVVRGIRSIDDRIPFEIKDVCRLGRDLKVTYRRVEVRSC